MEIDETEKGLAAFNKPVREELAVKKVKPQRASIDRTTSFLIPEDIIVLHVGKDLSFFLVGNQVNQIKDGEEHYNFVFGRNVYSREDVDIVLVKHKVDFLFEWGEKLDLFLQPQKIA